MENFGNYFFKYFFSVFSSNHILEVVQQITSTLPIVLILFSLQLIWTVLITISSSSLIFSSAISKLSNTISSVCFIECSIIFIFYRFNLGLSISNVCILVLIFELNFLIFLLIMGHFFLLHCIPGDF